jgi:hypothetical protein
VNLGAAAFALVLVTPVLAEDITASVPGHPGLTYETLLKLAMPDMTKNTDGGWDSGPLRNFRGLDDKPAQSEAKPPEDLQISFKSVDVASSARMGTHACC